MATFKRFEDMDAWQKARSYDLKSQMTRSSTSIMDNIAEVFERGGRKEFIRFLSIAKGSSGEIRSQLYRSKDYNYINTAEFEILHKQVLETSSILSGLIKYLQNSEIKGVKYIESEKH